MAEAGLLARGLKTGEFFSQWLHTSIASSPKMQICEQQFDVSMHTDGDEGRWCRESPEEPPRSSSFSFTSKKALAEL